MIVVDTSVWIAALRSGASGEAVALSQLLDSDDVLLPVPVRIEILSGASRAQLAVLRRTLSGLPLLYPTDTTWLQIDSWIDRAAKASQRFGAGDLLIGSLAAESGALVWSLDADFKRMNRLNLVDLYEP